MIRETWIDTEIDIERLIDVVGEYYEACEDYCYFGANKYKFKNYHQKLNDKDLRQMNAWYQMIAIQEVLKMNCVQREKLYVMARAINKWRIKTDYAYLISEDLQKRIREYIWGTKKKMVLEVA